LPTEALEPAASIHRATFFPTLDAGREQAAK